MKFMQRGAAAAAAATSTPEASSPATPRSDDGSAKRRKISHPSSATGSPATPLYDQKAIQAALEEEEKKRQAAIEKRAAELGDSHWVLPDAAGLRTRVSRPALNVMQVGFAQIDYAGASSGRSDGDDDPFDMGSVPGQTQMRRFNMKKSKACLPGRDPMLQAMLTSYPQAVKKESDNGSSSSDSESGSGSESGEASEDDDRSPASATEQPGRGRRNTLGEAERKRARSSVSRRRDEERKKAQQLAGKRRKKEIKLNQLTSISSAGSQAFQRPSSAALTCHGCGKPGHKVIDCPNKKR
jgi:hypothetical protein